MEERAKSEPAAPRRTTVIGLAAMLVIASVVALAARRDHGAGDDAIAETVITSPDVDPLRRPANEAELAILQPLAPGRTLEGWTIPSIEVVREGAITLQVRRGDHAGRLEITLAGGEGAPRPPARSGAYAVYYGAEGTFLESDGVALAQALAAVVARNPSVPVPPGLAPYRVDPPAE